MSDFPSISNILKKSSSTPDPIPASTTPAPVDIESAEAKFSQKMKELKLKEQEMQVNQTAFQVGLPYIDLASFPVSAEALRLVPEEVARAKKLVCFFNSSDELRFGVVELSAEAMEFVRDLGENHHANTGLYLISEHSLERVLRLYLNLPIVKAVTKDINITDEELEKFGVNVHDLTSLQEQFKNVTITNVVTLMIASALKVNASDMHIEAEEKGVAVRYRIDGILHDVATLPKEQWKAFVSRLKLIAALKINVTDRPQDGRVSLKLSSGSLDVRVSTLPTTYGESVVMRILHSGSKGVTFDELGLNGLAHDRLKHEIERPNGMIITTGPTGSGKTTTMYAILRTLNKPGVNIITLEDPVEIKMEGINQSQVDTSSNYTFAQGLRSILRQDPDICMVGEIRDLETAEIAIQAALTGHLLLSTIHTNSASGAIARFLSMGVKPFLLAPALNSVIGQRLVRRLCEHCKTLDEVSDENMKRIRELLEALPGEEKQKVDFTQLNFCKPVGCDKCSGLGYKGRIGIYELFTMTKEIEENILSGQVSEYTIQEIAVRGGMVTMVQDGLLKALQKVTSIEEVFRVAE